MSSNMKKFLQFVNPQCWPTVRHSIHSRRWTRTYSPRGWKGQISEWGPGIAPCTPTTDTAGRGQNLWSRQKGWQQESGNILGDRTRRIANYIIYKNWSPPWIEWTKMKYLPTLWRWLGSELPRELNFWDRPAWKSGKESASRHEGRKRVVKRLTSVTLIQFVLKNRKFGARIIKAPGIINGFLWGTNLGDVISRHFTTVRGKNIHCFAVCAEFIRLACHVSRWH